MTEYWAILYASARAPLAYAEDIDTGDLGEPKTGGGDAVETRRVHANRRVTSDEFDENFDTKSDFVEYLEENLDTGELGDLKIRKARSKGVSI